MTQRPALSCPAGRGQAVNFGEQLHNDDKFSPRSIIQRRLKLMSVRTHQLPGYSGLSVSRDKTGRSGY